MTTEPKDQRGGDESAEQRSKPSPVDYNRARSILAEHNAGRPIIQGDGGSTFISLDAAVDAVLAVSPSDPPPVREAVAWRSPEEVPETNPGSYSYRIVAVRRAHSEETYSFGAFYLNAVPLWFDDDNETRSVTGWNGEEEGGDGPLYKPLLGENDKLLGWCDFPRFDATPDPLPVSREAVARLDRLATAPGCIAKLDYAGQKQLCADLRAILALTGETSRE